MRRYRLFGVFLIFLSIMFADPVFASLVSKKATGEQKILVVMLKFPDVKPSFSREMMRNKYFDKLDRYLRSVSNGKTWIKGKMTDWHTLPRPVGEYRLSQHNLSVDNQRVTKLIRDAINLADAEDFSQYSMIFLSLGAKRNDYGMMGLCGYPGMLGWQSRLPIKTKKKGQEIPGGVAIYCEQAHMGVVFHDMAHIMGGVKEGRRILPCLYDHDLQSKPGPFRNYAQFYLTSVGYFDPMSCHYYKLKQGPPGVCAFTKLRLDWLDPREIVEVQRGGEETVILSPSSREGPGKKVVKIPIDSSRYFLIENRQSIGPDKNLPSHGMLIYECDDRIEECRHGVSPVNLVNAYPSIPELKGAPFSLHGKKSYKNEELGISAVITDQKRGNCTIKISNRVSP